MKLSTTIALALVVVTLLVGGAVYGSLELTKQQAVADVEANVDETARVAAVQIDSDVRERRDHVGYLASRPGMADLNDTARIIDPFLETTRFAEAQVIDANGTVVEFRGVSDADREAAIGSDASDEPYVRAALDDRTVMSDPFEVDDQYVAVVAAPILAEGENGNEIVGVFAALIRLDGRTVFTAVEALETSTQSVRIVSGDRVVYAGDGLGDSPRVRASATTAEADLTVFVSRDRSQLDSQLRFMALVQGGSLLVILLSVVGLGVWEYRVNLRQTNGLLAGFRRLREGEYDHELSLTATDEWHRISDGFNEVSREIRGRERALQEREQRLEVLNRVLRHNLSNDLNVVKGYLDMARERVDDEGTRGYLATAAARTDELIRHGEKARQVDRAVEESEAGPRPVDLTGPARTVAAEFAAEYPEVTVETDLPDEAWARAVEHVDFLVSNLVENACEHVEAEDPRVGIAIARTDDDVTLRVADNGEGIPAHELAVLDDGEETPLEHGSGLGLWVVHWLAEKSGAEIRFGADDGAVVTVTFEAADPPG